MILVVDDDDFIVDFLVTALETSDYTVEAAYGGREAYAKAKKGKPDLVILDIMMPDMHGFDVCQALRSEKSLQSTKILVSTAKGYAVDRRAAERLGADGYLVKPFSADELLKKVKSLVGEP
ncbi:MAG: response regulator [Elusimicrobiota bacterium]